jgi:3-phenylpropionate/cinnamic acid dioxygenase small subunit
VSTITDPDVLRSVEQFLYREARLCDEHRFAEWEALWTDDATYWVPANGDDTDPTRQVSVLFDNRARIATRVRQLESGKRHAQSPPSRLARIVANVELLADNGADLTVGSVFTIHESRLHRGTTVWAGRYEHVLRRSDDALRLVAKTVRLVDNDRPIPTLAFLA